RFEIGVGDRSGVPAIALHAFAAAGDQRAADGVARAALATEEAVRIGVHPDRSAAADRGAIGIVDPRVLAAGVLAGQGQRDRAPGVDAPGMPAVEVRARIVRQSGHQCRVGEAGGGVFLGVARDRASLLDRGLQAVGAQVGGAGAALALAEIHGDGNAAVAGGLDRLDLAHAHVHAEAVLLAAAHLGLVGAARAATAQQVFGDPGQGVQAGVAVI